MTELSDIGFSTQTTSHAVVGHSLLGNSFDHPVSAESLTPREMGVLELLGRGLSMKGVARLLDISPGTVKWHVKNVYEKLDVSSREGALSKARAREIIR